jgi:hypothetical protein
METIFFFFCTLISIRQRAHFLKHFFYFRSPGYFENAGSDQQLLERPRGSSTPVVKPGLVVAAAQTGNWEPPKLEPDATLNDDSSDSGQVIQVPMFI